WIVPAFVLMSSAVSRAEELERQQRIDFNRDIRPILSDTCFHCHGPDATQRKADLRLDSLQGLQADLGGYNAVSPGDPQTSALVARITHPDPQQRMPPGDSGRRLTGPQIDLIRRWIEQGAVWKKHWSFKPPVRPEPPEVQAADWPLNAIDRFVLSRQERLGLQPAPRADRETRIRRVTFDLTGLPPTLEEIDAFLADNTPDAYATVVDRLLKSTRYGERMTLQWLDAARYADTHGYSLDRRRVMWPWRDWVIQAYNRNMPFDQFMTEQLAGDLLSDATISQRVATGFNRNHPIQSEGGVINEEYRVETVVDRVETTASVFLGLTMGCCRCHDHKYEPLTQKEFYRFFAFFNNVPESAHVGNADRATDGPVVMAPSVLQSEQLQDLQQQIVRLEQQISAEAPAAAHTPVPVERIWIDDDLPPGAQALGNGSGAQKFVFVSKPAHPVFSGRRSSMRISQGRGQHLIQNTQPGLAINRAARLFTYVYLDPENPPQQLMLQWHDGRSWEHRAYWGGNLIGWGANGTASRRHMGPLPQPGQWTRLEVDAADVGLTAGSTLTGWAFTQFGGTVYWDRAGVADIQPTEIQQKLARLKKRVVAVQASQPTVMVMAEMKQPRRTFVLNRGQYDLPGETEVTAGLPEVLGVLPAGSNPDRLALAGWLASDGNPLTARVTVNRFWQLHFGTGLVKTPEDFGSQGEWPSHPALLDWLAREFMDSGWDVKAMHRLIVTSATYQQSSRWLPDVARSDPENRLLARGPRFRLDAEMIRDQALAVSGLLVEQTGGASVRPYQPGGLWGDVVYENVPRFTQDHGDSLYRRSMYTYWKRSVPPPNFQAFDAPTREACVLRRSTTNTPLAALVLMNDPTFVEAARKLAERVIRHGGDSQQDRLSMAFRLTTGRQPDDRERTVLQRALQDLHVDFRQDPAAAVQLMRVGESPYDRTLDVAELAAWTSIASSLLQLDETITRN
ncbi:MAG: PSD1 and planctomycete cytochrome C domain-containing protein, partial [Planctomycetaceae bacterium]